jgi:hypothetical protein
MLIGNLSKGDRQKIMTICTIDVHARDVKFKFSFRGLRDRRVTETTPIVLINLIIIGFMGRFICLSGHTFQNKSGTVVVMAMLKVA